MSGCIAQGETFAFASPEEALAALLPQLKPVGDERVALQAAPGRVLAEPVIADRDSPAVDVSAMDGYAVRASDLALGTLPVVAEVRIGKEPPALSAGTTIRIVTGGAIPPGAEAVLKREDVGEAADRITIPASIAAKPGLHLRRRGENLRKGETVVEAGTLVGVSAAAALATFGCTNPRVRTRVRVALLTTGDEVRGPDESPSPYELRDSHGSAIRALLNARPWVQLLPQRREADDPDRLRAAADELLREADALFLTGGVSMGPRDFIPAMLARLGARVVFHRIPQRPGKPILAAILPDGRPVLGLPGNPVSVMVTARRFAVPVLERLAGLMRSPSPPFPVSLSQPGEKGLDLWWHRLVRLTEPGTAQPVEGRGSGDVPAAARSDGFVEVPPERLGPGPWPFYGWS